MVLDDTSSLVFSLVVFVALGIERFLYGWCFIWPENFKQSCDHGIVSKFVGNNIAKEEYYWRHMQRLGAYVKVFQMSVIIYDTMVWEGNNFAFLEAPSIMASTPEGQAQLGAGIVLALMGQTLNMSAFRALGLKGVYYGYEFGYPMKRVVCFPYNMHLSDPQYWGVLFTVWGLYIALGASNFLVPRFELFWYLISMKILENDRGRRWASQLFGKSHARKTP